MPRSPERGPTRCPQVDATLEAYVDGDSAAAEAARLEAHLETCSACAEAVELAGRIRGELRSLEPRRCPDRVVAEVLARARGGPGGGRVREPRAAAWRWSPSFWAALAAVAVAALVAVGSALLLRLPPEPVPSPEEITAAEEELRWVLAYVGDVTRRSGLTLRDQGLLEGVVVPSRRALARQRVGGATSRDEE